METCKFCGTHVLVDYYFSKYDAALTDPDVFLENMTIAVTEVGATVLSQDTRRFDGAGYTAVLLLSESHASIHTWPEHGIATIDIYMCGDCDPAAAEKIFHKRLESDHRVGPFESKNSMVVFRGQIPRD